MRLSKSLLQEELKERKFLALHKVTNKGRNYSIAQRFLEDLEKFEKVLDEIKVSKEFHVVTMNRLYRLKKGSTILFDSFSIVLLQEGNELYIYYTPKYQLK